MSRPWVIWTMLVVCGLLIVGAMGWLTRRTLGMERERVVAEAEAKVEERVRLALSRMDTAASAMLVVENQRPPEYFQPFFEPKSLFTSALQSVGDGLVSQPSPLLSDPPEFVLLHFELWPDNKLTSPQVPGGNRRDLAEMSGVSREELETASKRLEKLRLMLVEADAGQTAAYLPTDNRQKMIAASTPGAPAWNQVPETEIQQRVMRLNDELEDQIANSYYGSPKAESVYQKDLTAVDRGKRQQVFEEAQSKAVRSAVKKVARNKGSLSPLASHSGASRDYKYPSVVAAGKEQDAEISEELKIWDELQEARQERERSAPRLMEGVDLAAKMSGLEVTPFRPLWVDGELVAVRQVKDDDGLRHQGFWVDAESLKKSLLEGIADLLPDADLERVNALSGVSLKEGMGNNAELPNHRPDHRALVTLPWRLNDGIEVQVAMIGFTPLRASLGIGWIAVLVAMLAAAILVRGVLRMSERRAAFVSSVTHELRTPLTTFQLYSDLLAEGMVRDEDKRQGYLETMRTEAGRLNHLIENVLSYSRIERGSARAQRERLPLPALIDRLQRRVVSRAETEGARIEVVGVEDCEEVQLETDVTAVEQIIFNLVDNACKYGLPDEGERLISLCASTKRGKVRIAVCDSGSGIVRGDRRKLFRPFHKSAHDAAESKPGVGLGLALCRRLARALGGELSVDCNRTKGACFVLELPAAR